MFGIVNTGDPLEYSVNSEVMGEYLMEKWVQLHKDEETREFLDICVPSTLRDVLAAVLRLFMSRTDANGIAGRGKMMVLSKYQMSKLCDTLQNEFNNARVHGVGTEKQSLSLLDIGSGDGSATERYSSFFERIVTTETSSVMARKLRARGWECYEHPRQEIPNELFNFITCMNVLDRVDKPLSLLESLRTRLVPEIGRLILAVVLPWCPFVEIGTGQAKPTEELVGMEGNSCRDHASFEQSFFALVQKVIVQVGFEIVAVSRVPYISQGDQMNPYYVLPDAIIVCKRSHRDPS